MTEVLAQLGCHEVLLDLCLSLCVAGALVHLFRSASLNGEVVVTESEHQAHFLSFVSFTQLRYSATVHSLFRACGCVNGAPEPTG